MTVCNQLIVNNLTLLLQFATELQSFCRNFAAVKKKFKHSDIWKKEIF